MQLSFSRIARCTRIRTAPAEAEEVGTPHRLAIAALAIALAIASPAAHAAGKTILITEPTHSVGYLPLYVALDKGFFTGLDVHVVTIPSTGAAQTDVLSGKAWGFIGGPEHDAYADLKGAQLKAIVNVVNRGNVYVFAVKGLSPGRDLKAFFKGKRIAVSGYGGTPNSIVRFLLKKNGLDPDKDVTLVESTASAIPAVMAQGKADLGVLDEPGLTKGIEGGLWQEPFYSAARALGPYAYSTINVTQATIDGDSASARAFVNGMLRGLAFVRDHRDETRAIAAKEYPDLTPAELKAALDRAYRDEIWEFSGKITPESVKTAEAVVKSAGLLTADVPYAEIVDPEFFASTGKRP
jgi:NitT/TauT family transport system substrate-binding protein